MGPERDDDANGNHHHMRLSSKREPTHRSPTSSTHENTPSPLPASSGSAATTAGHENNCFAPLAKVKDFELIAQVAAEQLGVHVDPDQAEDLRSILHELARAQQENPGADAQEVLLNGILRTDAAREERRRAQQQAAGRSTEEELSLQFQKKLRLQQAGLKAWS